MRRQFVVDYRRQLIERCFVALPPLGQQARQVIVTFHLLLRRHRVQILASLVRQTSVCRVFVL